MIASEAVASNSITCSNFTPVQKHDLLLRQRDDNMKASEVRMGVLVSLDVFPEGSTDKIPSKPVKISREVRIYQIISIPLDINYDSSAWDSSTFYLQLYVKPDKPIPVPLEQLWQNLLMRNGCDSINVGIFYFGPDKTSIAIIRSKYLRFNHKSFKVFKCTIVTDILEIIESANSISRKRTLSDNRSDDASVAKRIKTGSHLSNSIMIGSDMSSAKNSTQDISEQLIASKHYNELQREQTNRHLSLIYHLRSLNNVLKAELINFAMDYDGNTYPLKVIDFAAGKGGDLNKWFKDSGA